MSTPYIINYNHIIQLDSIKISFFSQSKKSKKTQTPKSQITAKVDPLQSIPEDTPFGKIIRAVVSKGFDSGKVIETLDKLWENGLNIEDIDNAVQTVIEHFSKKVEKPVEKSVEQPKKEKVVEPSPVPEIKEETSTPIETPKEEDFFVINKDLINRLMAVASLKNISQVLNGYNQWYTTASIADKQVFFKSGVIDKLFDSFFTNKNEGNVEQMFTCFFKTFYQFNDEIAHTISRALLLIKENANLLSISKTELANSMTTIINQCHKDIEAKSNTDEKVKELLNIIQSSVSSLDSITNNDVASQFKYRDLSCKLTKSIYSLLNLYGTLQVPEDASVDLSSLVPLPEGAEEAIAKGPEIKGHIQSIETKHKETIEPLNKQQKEEEEKLFANQEKEKALLKELEEVRKCIQQSNNTIKQIEADKVICENTYKQEIGKLDSSSQSILKVLKQVESRDAIVDNIKVVLNKISESFDTTQPESIQSLIGDINNYKQQLCQSAETYFRKEYSCISFLSTRISNFEKSIHSLAVNENKFKSLGLYKNSTAIHDEIVPLEKKVESNKNTLKVLKTMCIDNEMSLAEILNKDINIVKENLESVGKVYSYIKALTIVDHLSEEVKSLINNNITDVTPDTIEEPKSIITKPTQVKATKATTTTTTTTTTKSADMSKYNWANKTSTPVEAIPYKSIDVIQKEELNKSQ
ncbi:hypothetical protein WA158_000260 [Blastocystis sp. Blastoise]